MTTTTTAPANPTAVVLSGLTGWELTDAHAAAAHGLADRITRPCFGDWLTDAGRIGGCTQPVRLIGEVLTIGAGGQVLDRFHTDALPDRVLYKPCGTRRASLCPACAEVYRWDTYQLIKAGLAGGKGVPTTVAGHPAVFATLTAPSFGVVHHRVTNRSGTVKPCRPRRDKPTCPHGRALWCNHLHHEHDRRVGQPLCLDCYDHTHQAVWNYACPQLWDRTITRLRRLIRIQLGPTLAARVRVRYAKVAEVQARGVIHLHALIRVDGYDPDAILPPPTLRVDDLELPTLDGDALATLIRQSATSIGLRTPAHVDESDGWPIVWGQQLDTTVIRTGLPGDQLTERHVAGYLAKYATKTTEAAGAVIRRLTPNTIDTWANQHTHIGRLIDACWHIGRPDPHLHPDQQGDRPYRRIRTWAHMLGFRGHFATKSRRYSTTMSALRAARRPGNRTDPNRPRAYTRADADRDDDFDEETTLIIARWQYTGTGWLSTGDAALALMAANAARARRPAEPTH
jgi:hypothetical protein